MNLQVTFQLRLPKKYRDFNQHQLENEVWHRLTDFVEDVAEDARTYPPEPPGSRYVRTHRLADWLKTSVFQRSGRTWVVGLVDEVQDKWGREYARFVYGPTQTWFHAANGWIELYPYIRSRMRELRAGVRYTLIGE